MTGTKPPINDARALVLRLLCLAAAAVALAGPTAALSADHPPAAVATPAHDANSLLDAPSPDGLPLRLILALDGVPFDVFAGLQQRGHFAGFRPARRMVSTFPSLTDVSFATIAGSGAPEGYQVLRFDPERNRVVGNTIGSLSGKAHRRLPSDTRTRTVANRALGYVRPYGTALGQLRTLREDFLRSGKETFVAYVEASDWLLHIRGRPATERLLLELEGRLDELAAEVRRRTGRGLAIDIVSDHGSTPERGRRVRLERALEQCGKRRASRLMEPGDVAYAQAGIIGSVAMYSAPQEAEAVGRCLAGEDGVGFVSFRRDGSVVVLSADGGEAEVTRLDSLPERYRYRALRGDPLGLFDLYAAPAGGDFAASRTITLFQDDLFARTLESQYPDPLRRLWDAFHGSVQHPPSVLVSLDDGYEAANRVVRLLGMLRGRKGTHGSLTRSASVGVIVSNWREIPDVGASDAGAWLFGEEAFRAAGAHLRTNPVH